MTNLITLYVPLLLFSNRIQYLLLIQKAREMKRSMISIDSLMLAAPKSYTPHFLATKNK